MSCINLDNIDKKLLGLLQMEFPITLEPYTDLGLKLGINSREVIQRIRKLKEAGIVRMIGPVLDARKLGYQSTLVGMKVIGEKIEKAGRIIKEHPGISHGYRRDHDFNLWVTLSIKQEANLESELEQLASSIGVEAIFALPALKIFKLRAYFGADGDDPPETIAGTGALVRLQKAELSRMDRLVINELQHDLPLVVMPFTRSAAQMDINVNDFLSRCQSLLQRGIIRRFGASINHRNAGYKANAMVCWVVSPEEVDAAGRKIASTPEVSHCYERKADVIWPYNLFAMVHGHSPEHCRQVVDNISREIGISDRAVLFSTQELKKTRIMYRV